MSARSTESVTENGWEMKWSSSVVNCKGEREQTNTTTQRLVVREEKKGKDQSRWESLPSQ